MLVIVLAFGYFTTRDDSAGHSTDRSPGGGAVTVDVDRVVDGDTAKVFYEDDSEYVRYIGIDTPESVKEGTPVECFGKESSEFNASLIEGQRMKMVFDKEKRDHYGRLLAYAYVDGKLVQAEMLRRGYATTLEVSPNTSKANQFQDLEDEARNAGRGLWSAC